MSSTRLPGSQPPRGGKTPAPASPVAGAATGESKRRNPLGKRYPVWSGRWLFGAFLIGVAISIALGLLFHGKYHNVIRDMEIALAAIAAFMFLLLAFGLYSGARVRRKESITGDLQLVGSGDFFKGSDSSGCLDVGSFASGDGCGEAIAGIVIGILLMILLIIGLWLFVNVAIIMFFLLSIALGWAFHRAIRQVFSKSRQCRGDFAKSLYFAALYTVLYTGWLFLILWGTDYLKKRHKPPSTPISVVEATWRKHTI